MAMDLEDTICKIICDEYAPLIAHGRYHDEGRSDSAAHEIIHLLIRLEIIREGDQYKKVAQSGESREWTS